MGLPETFSRACVILWRRYRAPKKLSKPTQRFPEIAGRPTERPGSASPTICRERRTHRVVGWYQYPLRPSYHNVCAHVVTGGDLHQILGQRLVPKCALQVWKSRSRVIPVPAASLCPVSACRRPWRQASVLDAKLASWRTE